MICTSSQYFSRKEKVRLCKNNLKNQVVKLAVFVLICVLVGSMLGKGNQQTSYTFYYAQNKIVNKHTRGVFPPLNGQATQIFGCWAFAAKIGSDKMDVVGFKNYTLCFEKGSILVLIKKGSECIAAKGRFYFSWKVFSFNLFVSKSKIIQLHGDDQQNSTLLQDNSTQNKPINKHLSSQDTMSKPSTTPPSPSSGAIQQSPKTSVTVPEASVERANSTATTEQQIKCFKDKQAILDYVRALTVWTLRDGRLFLISEAKIESRLDISILVLDKIY